VLDQKRDNAISQFFEDFSILVHTLIDVLYHIASKELHSRIFAGPLLTSFGDLATPVKSVTLAVSEQPQPVYGKTTSATNLTRAKSTPNAQQTFPAQTVADQSCEAP
jgi:hypothetical protein